MAEQPVICVTCGRMAERAPFTWMLQHDLRRGETWVCDQCVRIHARSIEAKLDPVWW
jgi:hypothetical protein